MMSLTRPDRIEPAVVVEVADVAGPIPAVGGEGLGGGRRVLPVAADDGRALELDLPVVGDAHLDALGRSPDGPEPVVVEPGAAAGARLGRAVALEDRDAEVLPALLEGRRQERPGRQEEPEMAAELLVDAPEEARPEAHRQVAGDAAKPVERGLAAALGDLALDGAPEQVEHLRDDDHRGHPLVAQRIEDDPRVAAPDVQDVGTDRQRVEEPDRLLEQVRQRQQRDQAVLHPRHDPVKGLDRGDDVVVGEHHALRRPGRARGEDQLEQVARGGGGPRRHLRFPVGREATCRGRRSAPRRPSSGSGRGRLRGDRARHARCRGSGVWRRRSGRCPRWRRWTCAGRAARGSGRPASPRNRWPAGPASRATRSAAGRPARARGHAAARRPAASGGRGRDTSSSWSSRRRAGD